MTRTILARVNVWVALILVSGSLAVVEAQQEGRSGVDSATSQQEGMSLLQAVRLTLQLDPNLKLREASASLQEGVAREQTGRFDGSLQLSLTGEYRLQELAESRKKIEQDKRDELDQAIAEGEDDVQEAEQLQAELQLALANPPGSVTLSDPALNAELVLIDTLIGQAVDPVARNELIVARDEFLLASLADVSSSLDARLAKFDSAVESRRRIGDTPEEEEFYDGNLRLSFPKTYRTGVTFGPFLEGNVQGTKFKGKPKSADFGGKGIEDLYTFRVGVSGIFPTLRGSGTEAAAAFETAALLNHEASLALARHQSSVSALRTIFAYWDLKARQELVEIQSRSVRLQSSLLDLTEQLVDEGDIARAELSRARAGQARARARLEDAERQLHQAKVALAIAIGMAADEDASNLPSAGDDFPSLPSDMTRPDARILVRESVNRREDVDAVRSVEESARILVTGAERDKRPRLDVSGQVWATALGETSLSNAVDRWVGPSIALGLDLERPFGNNQRLGRLDQRSAELRQRTIETADLERQIGLQIIRLVESLPDATERVARAREAVEFYAESIEWEIQRLREGVSSLIDVLLTEDQQTGALIELVSAERDYANLIAQLRFETGQLIRQGKDVIQLSGDDLATPPTAAGRAEP